MDIDLLHDGIHTVRDARIADGRDRHDRPQRPAIDAVAPAEISVRMHAVRLDTVFHFNFFAMSTTNSVRMRGMVLELITAIRGKGLIPVDTLAICCR